MSDSSITTHSSTRNPILWGAYLACSWTWCIGMFYPTLLLRDFGWVGFLIFAIPNVLGAAAMGWVLKSRLQSERFVQNHPSAVWWFSTITLIFHVFWMLWIMNFVRLAFPMPQIYMQGVAAVVIAFAIISQRAAMFDRMPRVAMVLITFSIAALVATFVVPDLDISRQALTQAAPDSLNRSYNSLWMIPLMTFGFVFCPYLDITFHHARQQLDTNRGGRLGFTIGFVVFFALMIVLTTRYAGVMAWAIRGESFPDSQVLTPWLGAFILTHIMCQWVFTVRVHLHRIKTIPGAQAKQPILFALALISGIVGLLALNLPDHSNLTGGEIVYRTFLSFYGLLFPTYMLYQAVIARKNNSSNSIVMMWITIAIASPVFWMGFMERQSIWLIPGMVIVLVGAGMLQFITKKSSSSI